MLGLSCVAILESGSLNYWFIMPLDSTRQDFDIRPLVNQPLGAEVLGLDLARLLSDDDFDRLHRAAT